MPLQQIHSSPGSGDVLLLDDFLRQVAEQHQRGADGGEAGGDCEDLSQRHQRAPRAGRSIIAAGTTTAKEGVWLATVVPPTVVKLHCCAASTAWLLRDLATAVGAWLLWST